MTPTAMMPEVVVLSGPASLGPVEQAAAEDHIEVLNALQEQAREDIITLSQHGDDVSDFSALYDALWERVVALRARLVDLDASELEHWHASADVLERELRTLIGRTVSRRRLAPERRAFAGLAWGLGAAAVVASAAYGVWWYDKGGGRRRLRTAW